MEENQEKNIVVFENNLKIKKDCKYSYNLFWSQ